MPECWKIHFEASQGYVPKPGLGVRYIGIQGLGVTKNIEQMSIKTNFEYLMEPIQIKEMFQKLSCDPASGLGVWDPWNVVFSSHKKIKPIKLYKVFIWRLGSKP